MISLVFVEFVFFPNLKEEMYVFLPEEQSKGPGEIGTLISCNSEVVQRCQKRYT